MNLETLKNELPVYAKDIKLNLNTLLTPDNETFDLDIKQISVITLAAALTAQNQDVQLAALHFAKEQLTDAEIDGVKAATVMMGMNNIYYRFTHVIDDPTYRIMPAKLRMGIMASPGIDKLLFELASLAASAINGCSMCMNAHRIQLEKSGIQKSAIQTVIRITSVVHALSVARNISAT